MDREPSTDRHQPRGRSRKLSRYTRRTTATKAWAVLAAGALAVPATIGLVSLDDAQRTAEAAPPEGPRVGPAVALDRGGRLHTPGIASPQSTRSASVGPATIQTRGRPQSVRAVTSPRPSGTTTTTTTKPKPTTTTTQPPTTTTTTKPPPSPPATGSRDAGLWPFSPSSPWNTPIGSGARFESVSGPMTSNLRAKDLLSKDGSSSWEVTPWLNASEYSHPVYFAKASDPLVHVDVKHDPDMSVHIPAGAVTAAGTDGHIHVVQPDGRTIIEMWTVQPGNPWTAGRLEVGDLHSDGLGPDNGTRAYGGSAIGGLIRKWEVDPGDPDYTDGTIRHALAVGIPQGMLQYSGGNSGYDANGYGTARGYVWPATEQDYNSPGAYYGQVPMGSLLAIPKSVDVDALGLSPANRAIAKALQDYGAYVVDTTGGSTFAFYAEPTTPGSWQSTVIGPSWSAAELETIRQQLRIVTNNGPGSVGGGGTPLATTAPPFG